MGEQKAPLEGDLIRLCCFEAEMPARHAIMVRPLGWVRMYEDGKYPVDFADVKSFMAFLEQERPRYMPVLPDDVPKGA